MTAHRSTALELLSSADDRLVRTVDALSSAQLAEPSLLPDWTRGHVVAHLALNAEGLERVLIGEASGRPSSMYESQEARDADISELGEADPSELRDRLLAATHCLSVAAATVSEADSQARFERTPGGQQLNVAVIPVMRLREVEIHHADLGSHYTADDWLPEFAVLLLDSLTRQPPSEPFRVRAHDLGREWSFGDADGEQVPLVTGRASALGWWLTGRGSGAGLVSNSGRLPRIGAW